MRFPPLLLHALLSLALVANGIGAAVASVHAVCAHSTVAAAATAAEPPCHEAMGAGASKAHRGMQHGGMQHDNNAHRSADPGGLPQHGSGSDKERCGDCGNHCQCACIVHGLAALVPTALLLPALAGIAYTPAPSYAHAAPALPHPVRPPIG